MVSSTFMIMETFLLYVIIVAAYRNKKLLLTEKQERIKETIGFDCSIAFVQPS